MSSAVNLPAAVDRLITLPEGIPKLTLGWEALRFASMYLKHPNGTRAGLPWKFSKEQARFVLWWYSLDEGGQWLFYHAARRLSKGSGKSPFAAALALIEFCGPVRLKDFDPGLPGGCKGKRVDMPLVQIAATSLDQTSNTMRQVRAMAPKGSKIVRDFLLDPGRSQYNMLPEGTLEVITSSAATAEGAEATAVIADEALALDTPIPTPDGWTTPGQVHVGDILFGSGGQEVEVTYVTPVFTGRSCSRVEFSDGSSVVADDGHLWLAKTLGSAAKARVRSTADIARDGRRFGVPRMAPLAGRHVDLPIHPYVLGAWLGDGASRWPSITAGDLDVEFMLSEVRRCGVPAACLVKSGAGRAKTISLRGNANGDLYTKDGSSVRGALVVLGVLENKHIPDFLLRASYGQRLALLQGLMDTDGHACHTGSAVFVNANPHLACGVAQLARTFGWTVSITSRVDERWEAMPVIYKVTFRPDTDSPCFRMARKSARLRPRSARRWKTITSIVPVESVPVRCIEVDAPDHLFVAGDGWSVTHNTEHWLPANGGPELAATLIDNLTKSGNRMIETANAPKPGKGSVIEDTFDAWCAQEDGKSRNERKILFDARLAPPDTVLEDPVSLRAALEFVYADAKWADVDAIVTRIHSPKAKPDDSKRKYLNWPTASANSWADPQQWKQLSRPHIVVEQNTPVVMFFDGSKSRDDTALIGCRLDDGHVFTIGVWSPTNSHHDDETTPTIDVEAVDNKVDWAMDFYDVRAFYADVKEWEGFTKVTWPQRYRDLLPVHAVPSGKSPEPIAWDMRSHDYEFTMAAELVEAEIADGAFTHDGNADLTAHVTNARRRDGRWGISVQKETPNSAEKIDACVCLIGARMVRRLVLSNQPTEKEPNAAFFL